MLKKQWWDGQSHYEAAVINGKHSYFHPNKFLSFIRSISHGAAHQQCSVGEGEMKGNINDGHITEASRLAYSHRSKEVNIPLSSPQCMVVNDPDSGLVGAQ